MSIKKQRRQVVQSPAEIAATLLTMYRADLAALRAQGGQEANIAKVEALIARIAA